MTTGKLILLRHGQSQWNVSNQFTGWVDVALTEKGEEEARHGGELLRERGKLPCLGVVDDENFGGGHGKRQ